MTTFFKVDFGWHRIFLMKTDLNFNFCDKAINCWKLKVSSKSLQNVTNKLSALTLFRCFENKRAENAKENTEKKHKIEWVRSIRVCALKSSAELKQSIERITQFFLFPHFQWTVQLLGSSTVLSNSPIFDAKRAAAIESRSQTTPSSLGFISPICSPLIRHKFKFIQPLWIVARSDWIKRSLFSALFKAGTWNLFSLLFYFRLPNHFNSFCCGQMKVFRAVTVYDLHFRKQFSNSHMFVAANERSRPLITHVLAMPRHSQLQSSLLSCEI
jgi:hypothetical protein